MITSICFSRHSRNPLLLIVIAFFLGACAQAPDKRDDGGKPPLLQPAEPLDLTPVSLNPEHPQNYTVLAGDTLWSIAERFLSDPWRWRDIWRQNPEIRNPDLIYPGDVIELHYEAGQPRLQLANRRTGELPVIKLSPKVRVATIPQAIPTLPRDTIEQFLRRSMVLTKAEWAAAPYIIGTDDARIIFGAPDQIYARGTDFDQRLYQVFRPSEEYHDPATGDSLGFDVVYVGEAALEEDGDPATLRLTSTVQEGRAGDRLFPVEDDDLILQFKPHPAPPDTEGQIIAMLNGKFLIGQYQTVVLNLGEWDGMEPGHVLAVYNIGRVAEDPLKRKKVRQPDTRAGLLMIYKVFDRTSYGLITNTTRTIRPLDRVTEP